MATFTGPPIVSQTSVGTSASQALYSLRCLNGIMVKVVNIKRSSDGATQDFYADSLGNLFTTPFVGQPIVSWLAGSTGNVVTWYDQSGNSRDVSQINPANQATIDLSVTPARIVFTSLQSYSNVNPFTFNFGTSYNYTLRTVVDNTYGGCIVSKCSSTLQWNSNGQKKWWFGQPGSATESGFGYSPQHIGYSEGSVITSAIVTSSKMSVVWSSSGLSSVNLYTGGTLQSVTYSGRASLSDANQTFWIGAGGNSSSYWGNIYEIEVLSAPVVTSDLSMFDANSKLNTYIYTFSYTGAVQTASIPAGTYTFFLMGAQGGSAFGLSGGTGRIVSIIYTISAPITIQYIVGGTAVYSNTRGGGGGGGTFLYDLTNGKFIAVAGGGGGSSGNSAGSTASPGNGLGGGGGGFSAGGGGGAYGNGGGGSLGGLSFFNGGTGGTTVYTSSGGFGGGGAGGQATNTAGGGGGYTGGAQGNVSNSSGGTSYIDSSAVLVTDVSNNAGGNGVIIIC